MLAVEMLNERNGRGKYSSPLNLLAVLVRFLIDSLVETSFSIANLKF